MKQNENLKELFVRYMNNECSETDIKYLLDHFKQPGNEEQLRELIRQQINHEESGKLEAIHQRNNFIDAVFLDIKKAIGANKDAAQSTVTPMYRKGWFRSVAAAVVLVLVTGSVYLSLKETPTIPVAKNDVHVKEITDIPAGVNQAILTLDDGTSISLDDAANGALAHQGNTTVFKEGEQVQYRSGKGPNDATAFNTVRTANANQYQLILSDGTKVWLNAASSIRFPTSFSGKERKVTITGEIYFEVAKNPKMAFIVEMQTPSGQNGIIEVLGTHFNVNTYEDEPEAKTTLLEGSVKISEEGKIRMLVPGQQAVINNKGIEIKNKVDMKQVMAWRNGLFVFNNTDIYTLMRQVSRWYDVEVSFEDAVTPDGFSGKISRDVPLSQFIKVLELNDIRVERKENRKLTIGRSKAI